VAGDVRLDDRVGSLSRRLLQRRSREEIALLGQLISGQPVGDRILLNHLVKLGLVELRDGQPVLFADAFDYWVKREMSGGGEETAVASTPTPFTHLPEKRQVNIEGQTIDLTKLENRLLVYLSERMNQVCTTQELLQDVWGAGKTEAVVEKGINRLRKKIEQDPQRPRYILSARGEGYILRD
jgi:DNA-binding response OmpR family regulator